MKTVRYALYMSLAIGTAHINAAEIRHIILPNGQRMVDSWTRNNTSPGFLLRVAGQQGNIEQIERFKKEVTKEDLNDALDLALDRGHLDAAKVLLEAGASEKVAQGKVYSAIISQNIGYAIECLKLPITPPAGALQIAAFNQYTTLLIALLNTNKIFMKGEDQKALQDAAYHGNLEAVTKLLESGIHDANPLQALRYSFYSPNIEITKLLIGAGATVDSWILGEFLTRVRFECAKASLSKWNNELKPLYKAVYQILLSKADAAVTNSLKKTIEKALDSI